MQVLSGEKEQEALCFIKEAAMLAACNASCKRSKCGSVIVKEGKIIGEGFNSPPAGDESQRRCDNSKSQYHPKVTDKTCCVHAEQRAIMDALKNNADKIAGSILYFVRLDDEGKEAVSGSPYCTICSKMALDAGVKEFVLRHEQGVCAYNTKEYNDISFAYCEK